MSEVVVISGSPSNNSRSSALAGYLAEALLESGYSVKDLELKNLPAEDLLKANFQSQPIVQALKWVAESKLLILATPIYKVSYSGLLKVFLDMLPQDGLKGKDVIVVSTGGSPGHMLAIDYSLRPVLASMQVNQIVSHVFASDAQVPRDANGAHHLSAEIQKRLDQSFAEVLQLDSKQEFFE